MRGATEFDQDLDAGQGDLHADTKDKEGAEPVDDLFAAGAEAVGKPGGIGITDIDEHADTEDGDDEGAEVKEMFGKVVSFGWAHRVRMMEIVPGPVVMGKATG